ncbi:caspase family protein [Fuscibacter oryzae]|uniref:Caspase family protein n=1 Tax=Fuscibacter oryzae TaxID=2803939 RepID=A0A8J7MQD7_9RHOB|nr:caspase family protein [Fuscibacter oryzae]MBL4926999.1 caspase family protein [Fuscibacter oryzae]
MRRLAFAITLILASVPVLARENYALLIGVSQYPALDRKYWLKGPANDMALVATYLTTEAPVKFTPQNVVVLADGVPGATDTPTLGHIRDRMAALTARVQPGDFVYLHFSGHGTQAPAADPESELDGLDEVFLPRDIGPWLADVGHVQNALVDDEIGAMIDRLRAKGANVWAVFDSCHSGTVTRGAPDGEEELRTRQVTPQALGISGAAIEAAAARTRGTPSDPRAEPDAPVEVGAAGPQTGSFVAFFAAQTTEVTPEKNLPKGKPGRVPQGVFTYTLMQVLAEYPNATYGQIGQEVLRKYATTSIARTTPMFEGDLGQVAFSGLPGRRVDQWVARVGEQEFTIPAGSLHGLATGDVLAVMATAADATPDALGYARLTQVQTFGAQAVPIVQQGKALPDALPKGLMLRKIGAGLDFGLTVALPPAGSLATDALTTALPVLIKAAGPRITFVPAGDASADLRLAILPDSPRPDAVWVLPATGLADDLTTTPSVSTADKDAEGVAQAMGALLGAMAKAINLTKMAGAVGAGGLDVDVQLLAGPNKDALRPMPASAIPRLIPGDQVHVVAENRMAILVDVNVLYIGADWSISHWYSGRLQPGDRLKKGLFKISDAVLGAERLIIVLTPAAAQSPVEDLGFLAQPSLDVTRDVSTRSGLNAALAEAGFGQTTRSATALQEETADGPGPAILQLELRTVPAN